MPNILFLNSNSNNECLLSTAIIKSFNNQVKDSNFYVITNINTQDIFKYNKCVKFVSYTENVISAIPKEVFNTHFDIMINLNSQGELHKYFNDKIENKIGFGYTDGAENWDLKKRNMFQSYLSIIGLKWRGEGYDFNYTPKTKCKKNIGIAISNLNLKKYIIEKFKLENEKIWDIPIKDNIFKQCDEINICKEIITDNSTVMHLANNMRKEVHFLKTSNFNYKIELFGKGSVVEVPNNIVN